MKTLYDMIKLAAGGEDPVEGGTYGPEEIATALASLKDAGFDHLYYLDTQIRGVWNSRDGAEYPSRTVTVRPIIVRLPLEFLTPDHFCSGAGTLLAAIASAGHDGVRHVHVNRVLLAEEDARAVAATTEYKISDGAHTYGSVWATYAGQVQLTDAERVVFHTLADKAVPEEQPE